MKTKRIALLLAVITILQIIPTFVLPAVAEDGDDSVIGAIVRINTTNMFYMNSDVNASGGAGSSERLYAYQLPETMKILDVHITTSSSNPGKTFYKLGTVDGSAHSLLDRYCWIKSELVEIVSMSEPEPDDGLVRGEVGLVRDGEVVTSVTVAKGDKTYVFTELSDKFEGTPSYAWQLLIDRESNRWATLQDYVYPYAAVSEALIANARLDDGKATLRCIVTYNGARYVSGEVDIVIDYESTPKVPPVLSEEVLSVTDAQIPQYLSSNQQEDQNNEQNPSAHAFDVFQVVVQYVYWNNSPLPEAAHGETAMPTYTATVSPENPLSGPVPSTQIAGFKPYIRWEDSNQDPNAVIRTYAAREIPSDPNSEVVEHKYVEAPEIVFNNQTDGYEITVYYLPIKVSYWVNHYIQNVDDDEYILYHSELMYDYSEAPVGEKRQFFGEAEKLLDGYTSLYYDPNTPVSANGNTVLDIYYDRQYFLINFNLGEDGYGIMPLYVRYETTLQIGQPQKPGYVFDGWQLNNVYTKQEVEDKNGDGKPDEIITEIDNQDIRNLYADPSKSLIIEHNLRYTAMWEIGTTSYTVIYWLENANDNGFTLDSFEVFSAIPGQIVSATDTLDLEGSEEDHFVFLDGISDYQVTVKGDGTTAINAYYARKYYTLTFATTGISCALAGQNHTHGTNCDSVLLCTRETHTHTTDECGNKNLICVQTEHSQHDSACCEITTDGHTHSTSCFDYGENRVGNLYSGKDTNGANPTGDGYVYRTGGYGNRKYYIYIGGNWYVYNATVNYSGKINPDDSCPASHNHNRGECVCATPLHTHTEYCYKYDSCEYVGHEHGEGCYTQCSLLEHNCSTDDNFSITFEGDWNATTNLNIIKAVRAKYDSDTSTIWTIPGYEGKVWRSHTTGDYYSILSKMPGEDIILGAGQIGTTYTLKWYYALERLTPNTEYESGTYVSDNTGRYYYVAFSATISGDRNTNLTYAEDYFPITGFTQRDNKDNWSNNSWQTNNGVREMYLYYTRNSYKLIFNNGTGEIPGKTESVLYEADLSDKYFIPDIPSNREAGSVRFAGWYTTPTCADGTEFNFEGRIMPARDLTLYAKWEQTYWDVIVYQEKKTDNNPNPKVLWEKQDVLFGTLPNTLGEEPSRTAPIDDYIFAGWYYEEGGVEKRFDFNTMPIKHHYEIYAKWTSRVPVDFEVRYITTLSNGTTVEIADRTTGQSLAGITKSFAAKVGVDLYEDYRTGYFPTAREQTRLMEYSEHDEETNVVEFEYVTSDEICYRIKHVFIAEDFVNIIGRDTIELVWDNTVTTTSSAVHNEEFRTKVEKYEYVKPLLCAITGEDPNKASAPKSEALWNVIKYMSPDAFTQSKILVANDESTIEMNELVFNWVGRSNMTIYEVHPMFEGVDGKYTLRGEPQRYDVYYSDGAQATVPNPTQVKGYVYRGGYEPEGKLKGYATNANTGYDPSTGIIGDNTDLTLKKASTDEDGLIIYMFYDRATYNYTVRYRDENGFIISHHEVVSGSAKYLSELRIGDLVANIEIPGYELASADETVTLVSDNQVIDCVYRRQSANYNYRVASGSGRCTPMQEPNIPLNQELNGCVVSPDAGWVLQGWYLGDAQGNYISEVSAVGAEVENGKITPRAPTPDDVGKTFYFWALLVPTSLTITNSITESDDVPKWVTDGQGFIYTITGVTGTPTEGVSLRVAVIDSVTIKGLPAGSYTVTVENAWSWRYAYKSLDVDVSGAAQTVTFTYNALDKDYDDGYYITGQGSLSDSGH